MPKTRSGKNHEPQLKRKSEEVTVQEPTKKQKQELTNPKTEENKHQYETEHDIDEESDVFEEVSKGKYHPVKDAIWKVGEKVPYLALAKVFAAIQATSSRNENIENLSNLFRSIIALTPSDLLPCFYLCINRLGPEYEGLELGVGESIILKAIAESTARTLKSVKQQYNEVGDLGVVASTSRSKQKMIFPAPPLTIQSVYKKLKEIAKSSGSESQKRKKDVIKSILVAGEEVEVLYIIRSLEGKLRIGMAEKSFITALAHAIILTPTNQAFPPKILDATSHMSSKELKEKLSQASKLITKIYNEVPNYDMVIPTLLEHPWEQLPAFCHAHPGVPVKSMLAQPTHSGINEIFERFGNNPFTCEYKYDGERAQIHMENGNIKIFSRNMEDHTEKFPDVIENLPKVSHESLKSYIIDCEIVGWDVEKNKILPFQILTTRQRKNISLADIKVKVHVFAFDLLYLNGKSLLDEMFELRRKSLKEYFKEVPLIFSFVHSMDLSDRDEIESFFLDAIDNNTEGLLFKSLQKNSMYEAGKRSYSWLKLKRDYIKGLGDTFDLVVIGAYHGRGKRGGTYGAYLLACLDEETDTYQSVCKVASGLSDDQIHAFHKEFQTHKILKPKKFYSYGDMLEPDAWFEPVVVWEILAGDLSLSPVHKCAYGRVASDKGIGLRFPRFVRVRDDKKPSQATTSKQVVEFYEKKTKEKEESSEKSKVEEVAEQAPPTVAK